MADIELEMDVETYIKEKYPEALPLDLIPGRISRFDIEKRDNKAGWAIVFPLLEIGELEKKSDVFPTRAIQKTPIQW